MKYTIIKFFNGDCEIVVGNKTCVLTNEKPSIIINEDEYEVILQKYESMIVNKLLLVQRIEPKIETKEDKKFNKK